MLIDLDIYFIFFTMIEFVHTAAPVFTVPASPGRTFPITETTRSGTSVYRVVAIDVDDDVLIFSITSHQPASPIKFNIGSTSGIISTMSEFDVDEENAVKDYELRVRVTDGTNMIETTLNIEITDDNDNAPVFKYYQVIREQTKPGTIIANVLAEDVDSQNNGKVTYRITGGNTDDAFGIDSSNGILYTMYSLRYEKQSMYKLQIEASDGGVTSRSATMTLTLSLKESLGNRGYTVTFSSTWIMILLFAQIFLLNLY